jgi:hypothetical protein
MDFYPTEGSFPLQNEGPANFFPPVCNEFHFDPTQIIRHTLPDQPYNIPLPLDPRPWTKVCLEYVNSTTNEPAPTINPNIAFPGGGFFQDPNRYLASVDSESSLRRLDQPLRKCDKGKFEPNANGDMFNSRILVTNEKNKFSGLKEISELALPKATITVGPYKCRAEADTVNMSVSNKPFFNATKQERYYIKPQGTYPTNLKNYQPLASDFSNPANNFQYVNQSLA